MSARWVGLVVAFAVVGCGGASKRAQVPDGAQDAGRDVPLNPDSRDGGDAGATSGDGGLGTSDGRTADAEVGDTAGDLGIGDGGNDVGADGQGLGKPAYIIDDMERADMVASFLSPAGFLGKWSAVANYVVGQQALPSASQIIRRIQPPRGTSERAAMFSTDPIEDGADLFIDLRPLIGSAQHVDLSRYTGIAFWSRMVGGPANPNRNLIVAIKDDRYPVNDEEFWVGQTMTTPWFSAWAAARPSWQRQEIRFSEFAQRLGLTADSTIAGPTLRTNAIASIHFTTLARVPFELWIDDLVLTCAGPCPGEETPIPPVCTPGADQTCNDNPAISSLHGMCTPAGICVCQPAYAKNPATGKCL